MIDTIPGTMTKGKAEEAARKWQKEQDEFPSPVPPASPQPGKPKTEYNEFHDRQVERAQRQENYMRHGTSN